MCLVSFHRYPTNDADERAVIVYQSISLHFQEEDFDIIQHCPERVTINSSFSLSTSVFFCQLSFHQSLHIRPPAILSMDSGPIADCSSTNRTLTLPLT